MYCVCIRYLSFCSTSLPMQPTLMWLQEAVQRPPTHLARTLNKKQEILYLQWKTNKHNITITHTQKVSLPGSRVLRRVPRLTLASFTSLSERPTEQEGSEVEERRSQLWTKKSPEERFLYTRLWGFTSCFLSDQRSTGCGYQPSDSQLTFTLSSSPHTTDRKGGLPEAR